MVRLAGVDTRTMTAAAPWTFLQRRPLSGRIHDGGLFCCVECHVDRHNVAHPDLDIAGLHGLFRLAC